MWLNTVNSILLSPLNVYLCISRPTAESTHYVRHLGFSLRWWPREESTLGVMKRVLFPETSSGKILSGVGLRWVTQRHVELREAKFTHEAGRAHLWPGVAQQSYCTPNGVSKLFIELIEKHGSSDKDWTRQVFNGTLQCAFHILFYSFSQVDVASFSCLSCLFNELMT